MKKTYKSEEEVKKELKITDYNNITEGQLDGFIKMFPRIDKDVAIKIINQIPDYTKFATGTITALSSLCTNVMKNADERGKQTIAAYQKIIDTIAEHLKKGDLSEEEREKDTQQMIELAQKIESVNDKTNAMSMEVFKNVGKNILKVAGIVGVVVIGVALGSKLNDNDKK